MHCPCGLTWNDHVADHALITWLTLHTARFARTVRVNIINSREKYSDNYFDMDAGETRTIAVTLQEEWKEEEILSAAFSVEAENQKLFVVPVPADLNAGGQEH